MRFQVPQFIEVEDKIFGPLSFKQFAYIAGAAGLAFIVYKFTPIFVWLLLVPLIIGFGLALAFYKVNNKPFIEVVQAAINFYLNSQLYIWRKQDRKATPTVTQLGDEAAIKVPKLNQSRLKELTWSLDVNEGSYAQETKTLQKNAENRLKAEEEKNSPFDFKF